MKLDKVESVQDAERYCEGLVNDFQNGIIHRGEMMSSLRDYTFHLHKMFEKVLEDKYGIKLEKLEALADG